MMIITMLVLVFAQPSAPLVRAPAMVRILAPSIASEAQWKLAKRKSERLVRDEHGRLLRLRTIDFE